MAFWVPLFVFVASTILGMVLRSKPRKSEPYEPYGWDPQTVQREDIPIEHCIGTVPVEGNVFSPYTDVVNTTEQVHWVLAIVWGLALPLSVNQSVRTSAHKLYACIAFGDGPNVGLVAGSAYLNDKLLTDWSGVTTVERLGTDIQTGTGVADRFEIGREDKVAIGSPVTVTMPDSDYTDLAILIGSPTGLVGYAKDGHTAQAYFDITIEIRPVGGAWHTLFDYYLFARSPNPVRWLFTASGTYQGGSAYVVSQGTRHEWRVTCIAGPAGDNAQGELYVLGVQQIYTIQSTRPGLHYLAVSAIAKESLSGALRFKGVVQGKILETIAGGSFAFSRCPAVGMKWAWTRPVIKGDGGGTPYAVDYYRGYNPSKLNATDFAAYEAWCDELVDDGNGGTEPRFQFDGRFSEPEEAWSQATKIGAMSHAVPWLHGNEIRVYVDDVCAPTHVFCDANMIAGSYRETPVDKRSLPSAIKATIVNAAAGYIRQTVQVVDSLATTDRVQQVDGFGHSSVSQLIRWARRVFDRGRYHDLDFTWQTGPAGLDARKGDTAYIQADCNGRAVGSTVSTVPANNKVVIKDPVTLTPGTAYKLIVQTLDADGKHVVAYDVASLDNSTTIVITGTWTYTPARRDVVIYGAAANIQMVRITGANPDQYGNCTFTGEQYRTEYYTRDDDAPDYDTAIYIADAKPKHSAFDPVTRDELRTVYGLDQIVDGDVVEQISFGGITFVGDDVDTVTWTGTGDGNIGWVRLGGVSYPIQTFGGALLHTDDAILQNTDDGPLEDEHANYTTLEYIYFDKDAADNSRLYATNDASILRGELGRVPLCRNIAGVAHILTGGRLGTGTGDLYDEAVTHAAGGTNEIVLFIDDETGTEIKAESGFVTTGGSVEIVFGARVYSWFMSGDGAVVTLTLYCDGVALATIPDIQTTTTGTGNRQYRTVRHDPAAGSHDYTVVATIAAGVPQLYANAVERTLLLREIKR